VHYIRNLNLDTMEVLYEFQQLTLIWSLFNFSLSRRSVHSAVLAVIPNILKQFLHMKGKLMGGKYIGN